MVRKELALVTAGFTALTLLMLFPLVARAGHALPGDLGDPLLNAWILGWDAERLAHGLAGVWDAPILYPTPHTLAYSEHLFGVALFVAPVYWLSANAVLAHNVAFLGSYVLAAVGMYLLAQSLTRRRDAAVIAAVIFAFGPPRAAAMTHLQVLLSGWMPVALWALHRYLAAPSWPRVFGFAAAFSLQALSNGYFLFFLALPVTIVAIVELRRRRDAKTVVQLAVAACVIVAAVAPFAIVYIELRRQGFHRSYSDWVALSADVGSYVQASGRVWMWRWLPGALGSERQLFPGLTAIVLAAVALWPGRSRATSHQPPVTSHQPPVTRIYLVTALVAFVLSLGPEPRAWGHQFAPVGPYLWLTYVVPGLDGLRVPARLSIVVFLALAVLAASGAARLLGALTGRRRAFAFSGIAVFALAEGAMAPIPMAAFDGHGRPEDRAAYRWLAAAAPGAVLELPIREWDVTPTLIYQYATLVHGHPIANGYSGYGSALQEFLGGGGSPLRELEHVDGTLAMLRAIGFRYVLVHPRDYGDVSSGAALVRAIVDRPAHLAGAHDFGAVTAFELGPPEKVSGQAPAATAIAPRRITPDHVSATASHNAERLPLAFDGDLDTRWTSGEAQAGTEWIFLQLDRPYFVSRVSVRLGRWSLGDYPRELEIEATRADGATAVVYAGDVLRLLGLGLVRNGGYPSIDIEIPPTATTALRLRQRGHTRRWFWSVHEIEVWERP